MFITSIRTPLGELALGPGPDQAERDRPTVPRHIRRGCGSERFRASRKRAGGVSRGLLHLEFCVYPRGSKRARSWPAFHAPAPVYTAQVSVRRSYGEIVHDPYSLSRRQLPMASYDLASVNSFDTTVRRGS